jgi:hypothetical protein
LPGRGVPAGSPSVSAAPGILRGTMILRADPWAPGYGMGFEARVDEPYPAADTAVETADWTTPLGTAAASAGSVCFVDGVRRVELRVLADEGPARAPGLFGSFAVGAVRCDGRAAFDEHLVGRALIVGGGLPARSIDIAAGSARLLFEGVREPSLEPDVPLQRLQDLMRDEENSLAARLVGAGAPLVIVDGPLRLGDAIDGPIVGAIKRFVRRYLEPTEDRLLGRLAAGQRTPVFALLDKDAATRGYSWYTRVAQLRGPWHDRAGVLRCEVRASLGLDTAVAMADRVSALLPSFAGRPADPRTPQNLVPIAGLESWLRHRMGDARMIRRALLIWLSGDGEDG